MTVDGAATPHIASIARLPSMEPLEHLVALPAVDGHPMAAHGLELVPVSVSIISAMRDEEGAITDFRLEYSNLAASATSPDLARAFGQLLFDIVPAFREVGLFDRYVEVLASGDSYTQEDVRLAGTFGGAQYDLRLDIVATALDEDHVLSVSRDRTAEHQTNVRLGAVQATLSRRQQMERQINAVNAGLVNDLVEVQRALDRGDVEDARRHAAEGAQRAAEVVTGVRDAVRTGV